MSFLLCREEVAPRGLHAPAAHRVAAPLHASAYAVVVGGSGASALRGLEVKPYYDNVWSSAYYVVCVFRDSDDLESFIREYALAKYGDLYMDGSKILEALEA